MRKLLPATACCLLFAAAATRVAAVNLVTNGNFTDVTSSVAAKTSPLFGQFGNDTGGPASGSTLTVGNWNTTGYNFVYVLNTANPGTSTADSGTKTGANIGQPNEAPGQFNTGAGFGSTYMYGSNNGGTVTLPATDPAGGNFIAADGAYETAAITQTITGLTVGSTYALNFYWAGGQEESFTGITTDNWGVTFGSQTFTTPTVTVPSKGFSGWMPQTFTYTASATSQTLSFLAAGTPTGQPPFAMLGGVSLVLVPEPSTWALCVGLGVAGTVFGVIRRRRLSSVAPVV